jgi:hypothetical protein
MRFGGAGYDPVTTFDSLHDVGNPAGPPHVRQALADDGIWLTVEPAGRGGR